MHTDDSWFILRTAGRSTLTLARTLAEDGFDVWTPSRTHRIRLPRANVKRDVKLPMLPSFIFVRSAHLPDLLTMARMTEKPRRDPNGGRESKPAHKDFTVFHYLDRIPMVADRSLEPLRQKEMELVPRRAAPQFNHGTKVRVNCGAFEGLKGRVERCKSGYALVIFDDWKRPAKIPTWLLREDEAFYAPAARAA